MCSISQVKKAHLELGINISTVLATVAPKDVVTFYLRLKSLCRKATGKAQSKSFRFQIVEKCRLRFCSITFRAEVHMWLLKGLSPMAHALPSENKLEKDVPSFSSSVGDFGRRFLAVEISAIVR